MSDRNTLAHFLHDAGLAAWFGGSLSTKPRSKAITATAIGAHLLGGAQLLRANKGRVKNQKGVLANTNVKLALTAGAIGATAYSWSLEKKAAEDPQAEKQLAALQWAVPGLTGAVMASSSLHEEQQRPAQVLRGSLQSLPGKAAPVLDKARDTAIRDFGKARDTAGPALEKARDAAGPALEKAREAASSAYEKATDRAKALPVHG